MGWKEWKGDIQHTLPTPFPFRILPCSLALQVTFFSRCYQSSLVSLSSVLHIQYYLNSSKNTCSTGIITLWMISQYLCSACLAAETQTLSHTKALLLLLILRSVFLCCKEPCTCTQWWNEWRMTTHQSPKELSRSVMQYLPTSRWH